jgi:hypothetical protein
MTFPTDPSTSEQSSSVDYDGRVVEVDLHDEVLHWLLELDDVSWDH